MKFRLLLSIMVICLMASGVYATNNATASGNWTDASVWTATYGSPINLPNQEEIKIGSNLGLTVTVNSDVGTYSTVKINTAMLANLVVTGNDAWIGSGRELNIGAGPAYGGTNAQMYYGDMGYLTQSGGVIEINRSGKLALGFRSSGTAETMGKYTISGGTLQGTSTASIRVGCSSGDGMVGIFKVVGTGGTINFGGAMYIANDSSTASGNTGRGIIEFVLDDDGAVSPIKVAQTIVNSMNGAESASAHLNIDWTAGTPAGDVLLLIQNTGTSDVTGQFTWLNGGSAAEGTYVTIGTKLMKLTYLYDADDDDENNDLALIIPEPATIALLSLGLFVIRRKK